ncbi:MAG: hypothetical protein GAK35_03160 [Herbaspirillum frisingense]|uniref:Uncharacterized protein n=1 Tax=Herbaspirillum frisingense TaxID=92645 RepID=A0A7V8FUS0_9BURK|nr:MAG: hypothetical protein GAK35_03160 [Herbaspirillum frisingense]
MATQHKPAEPARESAQKTPHPPPLPPGQGSHNDGKEYGTAKRPAGGAHADPSGKHSPG